MIGLSLLMENDRFNTEVKEMDDDIASMLASYRSGQASREQFVKWLDEQKARIAAQLPRGSMLKIRHGSDYAAATALASLLPACSTCNSVCDDRTFSSWDEYEDCERRVNRAEAARAIGRIKPPIWAISIPEGGGADAYYRCSSCGAIWGLVRPEKQERGSWHRLA